LSLKRLESNPWDGIQDRFIEDDVVEGKVSCLSSSGVFVKIEDNLEGLLKNIEGPDDLLPGTDVKVRLITIDTEKERIDLELITSDD
jgi:small subunit ribosomal protein S1